MRVLNKKALWLSLQNMEQQGLALEMHGRDGRWYEVDLTREDPEIELFLTTESAITDMLAGREAKIRRANGMISRFRFSRKRIVMSMPSEVPS